MPTDNPDRSDAMTTALEQLLWTGWAQREIASGWLTVSILTFGRGRISVGPDRLTIEDQW